MGPLETGEGEMVIPIRADSDIVDARMMARQMADELGFSATDLVVIATAVSEVARNIVEYAKAGEIALQKVEEGARHGLVVTARDTGPGIRDVGLALQEGYSTSRGMGMGLPGARRLMDDFVVESLMGHGTTVIMRKWRRRSSP